jgi:lysophospholipase L1-like esterase
VSLSNVVADTLSVDDSGIQDVVWDAVAFQLLPGKPRNQVVALGDSYSSGEGASRSGGVDYFPESAHDDDGRLRHNGCHRSREAWSRKGVLRDDYFHTIGQRADSFDPNVDYALLACSNAHTQDLLPDSTDSVTGRFWQNGWGEMPGDLEGWDRDGRWGEVSQLDKGFLDENTTLVTLTIGGNDLSWDRILQTCIEETVVSCKELSLDGMRIADKVPLEMEHEYQDSLRTVLRAIAERAPNAVIMLMGYPQLFSAHASCLNVLGFGLTAAEADWLNDEAAELARTDAEVAQLVNNENGIHVHLADPIRNGDFIGKGVCGDPETINGIVRVHAPGEDPLLVSAQSFHPKISGTSVYAQVFNQELRNVGM